MPKIKIDDSHILDIPLDPPAPIESFFIFGINKCGSTLINKIFIDICNRVKIPCISIPFLAFKQGIPEEIWVKHKALNSIIIDGFVIEHFVAIRCF